MPLPLGYIELRNHPLTAIADMPILVYVKNRLKLFFGAKNALQLNLSIEYRRCDIYRVGLNCIHLPFSRQDNICCLNISVVTMLHYIFSKY